MSVLIWCHLLLPVCQPLHCQMQWDRIHCIIFLYFRHCDTNSTMVQAQQVVSDHQISSSVSECFCPSSSCGCRPIWVSFYCCPGTLIQKTGSSSACCPNSSQFVPIWQPPCPQESDWYASGASLVKYSSQHLDSTWRNPVLFSGQIPISASSLYTIVFPCRHTDLLIPCSWPKGFLSSESQLFPKASIMVDWGFPCLLFPCLLICKCINLNVSVVFRTPSLAENIVVTLQ